MLRDLEKHLIALGINPVDVVELGRGKQLKANQMMLDELGYDSTCAKPILTLLRCEGCLGFSG